MKKKTKTKYNTPRIMGDSHQRRKMKRKLNKKSMRVKNDV